MAESGLERKGVPLLILYPSKTIILQQSIIMVSIKETNLLER